MSHIIQTPMTLTPTCISKVDKIKCIQENKYRLEIVDQWSTSIPPGPHRKNLNNLCDWPLTWKLYVTPNHHCTHLPFLSYSNFNILPWKSKVKVMGEVKVWSHNVSTILLTHPFRSMSISHPIPEIRLFQNLTLKIQGQDHGRGEHWKSQHGSNILST